MFRKSLPALNQYSPARQRGVVLVFALIFLAAIALISMTLMQTSTMELRMAGNEQERVETLQKIQAIIDQIVDDEDYFPVLATGTLICQVGDSDPDCDSATIDLSTDVDNLLTGDTVTYRSFFRQETTPPRANQAGRKVYGSNWRVAYFDIDVDYKSNSERGSDREVAQGVERPFPITGQGASSPDGTDSDTEMQKNEAGVPISS